MTHRVWYRARTLTALGNAVKGARESSAQHQDKLATRIGSSRPTVSRLERGVNTSTQVLLDALAACGYEAIIVPRGARIRIDQDS